MEQSQAQQAEAGSINVNAETVAIQPLLILITQIQTPTGIQKVHTTSQTCRNCGGTYPHERQCPAQAKHVKNVARLIISPKFAKAEQRSLTILHEMKRQRPRQTKTKPTGRNAAHSVSKARETASSDDEYLHIR